MPHSLVLLCSILCFSALATSSRCRIIPEDVAWPPKTAWDALNASVEGRLIHTTPLASVCHGSAFDAVKCAVVQQNWQIPEFHEASSSSIMSAPFSNRSCDPFAGSIGCKIGSYVEYTVNVSSVNHVVSALQFATEHNIRFVVRNSGHDFMGKSTGHGALAIWTHFLTETEWISSYSSPLYQGPALKAHAGVSVLQIYEEAAARGYAVTGGACTTVGLAGGFVQGGGHGPLSTKYGLLADNVLSFEVITTDGRFVNASLTTNSDLFWAMSGGGPGTYGILWSVTVKVYPDQPFSGASVTFTATDSVDLDTWWKGVEAYRSIAPNVTAAGGYIQAVFTEGAFQMTPLILPNATIEDLQRIIDPFLSQLNQLGIPFQFYNTSVPSFLDAYTSESLFPTSLYDIQNAQVGGRLLPKSIYSSAHQFQQLNNVTRTIVHAGAGGYELVVAPSSPVNNSVLPAWREAQTTFAIFLPWNDTGTTAQDKEQQNVITNQLMPLLKELTPGSGSYLNEADPFDLDWKQDFYGSNYDALLSIKDRWDENQILYGSTAVGGDRWIQTDDGRLCQVC